MKRGRCLRGAVSWAYEGPENWQAHCHCESCRRNTASPFTTFLGVPLAAFRWTGVEPVLYRSSPGVRRRFCATCGTPVSYEADRYPGEIHLYAAALEDPGAARPQAHVHLSEKLPWIDLADDLPKHPGSSA